MKTTDITPKARSKKNSGPTKLESPKLDDHPDLRDTFSRNQEAILRLQLFEEHITQMNALQQMHEARLQAVREQVQIELFKIWNEMWLQKKAVFAKAHKEFLKVLSA